jgi:hypothetical protein
MQKDMLNAWPRARSINQDVNLQSLCAAVSRDFGMACFAVAIRGRAANALLAGGSTRRAAYASTCSYPA